MNKFMENKFIINNFHLNCILSKCAAKVDRSILQDNII